MPKLNINGCKYHYEIFGSGPQTLVLSHGLLWSGKMFHKQIAHFKDRFRIVTYDHRGQGQSEVTDGGYHMDGLFDDAVQLIEQLQLGPVHFGGLSMGGFVAMRLAARRPDLVRSLILMETSAQPEPNKIKYTLLKTMVILFGVEIVARPVMNIMFGDKFLRDPQRKMEMEHWRLELIKNGKTIVRAVEAVINRKGVESELAEIRCPTLILVGTNDKATSPEKAEFIHSNIPGSELQYIENGGHTCCLEEPEAYNRAIETFLGSLS